eukprot:g2008.t1
MQNNRNKSSSSDDASSMKHDGTATKEIELRSIVVDTKSPSDSSRTNEEKKDDGLFARASFDMIDEEEALRKVKISDIKIELVDDVDIMGNTKRFKVLKRKIQQFNLIKIFKAWDVDSNDRLTVKEIQYGLCNVGVLLSRRTMLKSLRKISERSDLKNHVLAREFSDYIIELCNRNVALLDDLLRKLSKSIPSINKASELKWIEVHEERYMDRRKSVIQQGSKRTSSFNDDEAAKERGNIFSAVTEDAMKYKEKFNPRVIFEMLTFQRGAFPAVLMFFAWQFGFSLFYSLYDEFRFDRAFYYSAQAGLSVGFGALSEEVWGGLKEYDENCTVTNQRPSSEYDVSKLVTIFNVLLGSSVIGGALGYFIDSLLEEQEMWYENLEKEESERMARRLKKKRPRSSSHNEETKTSGTDDNDTSAAKKDLGGDSVDDEGGDNGDDKEDAPLTWREFYDNNSSEIRLVVIVLVLVTVGVTYGMVDEDWTFISSIYFGITAMSTGGLQTPTIDSSALNSLFTGCFVLIGVPVYGCCLGFFANLLVAERDDDSLKEIISGQEFQAMRILRQYGMPKAIAAKWFSKSNNGEEEEDEEDWRNEILDKVEFLQMELLRSGKIDIDFVVQCNEQFEKLDVDGSGQVSWTEMIAANAFEAVDVDDSGFVDFDEFVLLVQYMKKLLPKGLIDVEPVKLRHIFHNIEANSSKMSIVSMHHRPDDATVAIDGKLSRREFAKFVEAVLSEGMLGSMIRSPKKAGAKTM